MREAKARGNRGRVNSCKRIDYAKVIGVDSIDGTEYVRWRSRYLDQGLTDVADAQPRRTVRYQRPDAQPV